MRGARRGSLAVDAGKFRVVGVQSAGRRRVRSALLGVLVAFVAVTAASGVARASGLPDGRAFEQVSEPNTGGNPAFQEEDGVTAVLSDDAVIYGGGFQDDLPSPASSGGNPTFLATRGTGGWSTSILSPSTQNGQVSWSILDATPSLSAAVFSGGQTAYAPPPPDDVTPSTFEYRDASGAFSTIATNPDNYAGMSADGQTVVFASNNTTSGTPLASGLETLFAWHPDGSSSAIEGGTGDALAGCNAYPVSGPNAVSADGSTVFFQSGSGSGNCPGSSQVYASVDGHSQEISVSTDGTSDPQSTALTSQFMGATPDGQTAYFISEQPLTVSAGPLNPNSLIEELYQWTAASASAPASVTCLSCGLSDDQGLGDPQVAVSMQGDYVYFSVSNPNVPAGSATSFELFAYHDGATQLVDADQQDYLLDPLDTQMSPAGTAIVFARDETGVGTNFGHPLYWSTATGSGYSAAQCVTCGAGGALGIAQMATGDDGFGDGNYRGASTMLGSGDDALSADGNTVAFETADALGASDSSYQVYEWTPGGGDQFIANGDPATLAGDAVITPDAQDIFFYSADTLTSTVTQPGNVALYDARVGGGFPTATASAPCSADGCRGATPVGTTPTVASGAGCCGNVSAPAGSLAIRRPSSSVLRRVAHDGRLTVALRVRGRGRLRVTLTTTRARRQVQVAHAARSVTATRTRTVSVTLTLSTSARRALSGQGRLAVRVTAQLPGAADRTLRVTLTAPESASTGGRS